MAQTLIANFSGSKYCMCYFLSFFHLCKQLEDKLPQKEKEELAAKMETFQGSKFKRFQQFLYSRRMIHEKLKFIGTKKA